MAFQISPGVNVSEIDLTTIVPAVSTTTGAFAGVFRWGPVNQAFLVSSEDELVKFYGKPTANNYETFFTAANFLSYGNQLYISRAADGSAFNATGNTQAVDNVFVKNRDDFNTQLNNFSVNTPFIAKYPGVIGNSLKVSVCTTANVYQQILTAANIANTALAAYFATTTSEVMLDIGSSVANVAVTTPGVPSFAFDSANTIYNAIFPEDYLTMGNTTIGTQYMQVVSTTAPTLAGQNTYWFNISFDSVLKLKSSIDDTEIGGNTAIIRNWEYFNSVNGAPGISNYVAQRVSNTAIKDEVHIIVSDNDGAITGVPGQILEVWPNLSRASDAKGEQGGSIYYRDVLNNSSQYVWAATDYLGSAVTNNSFPTPNVITPVYLEFMNGSDGMSEYATPISSLAKAYDEFASAEHIDISLVLTGKATTSSGSGEVLPNYLIDNIAEKRRDCVVFVSPPVGAVVSVPGFEQSNVVAFRNLLRSSSYSVLDSGYKYQYDKYNDLYRWVPLNGDIAGLCVRTDNTRDPWFSPAGFNRGQIKNVVKLAYNPNQANRDQLYKNGINPVVTFPGQGTVLYGDKTMLATPSAFDRINVRRLFIVLEKAISTAAKFALFEFNDDFTRAAFRNLVEPYLRDVQGRRGIYDFRVVCDATNNTPEVIDANQFRGDIYIKPARSINFIQLNFVAVRTGVEFDEIVGKF
jgi:phage tail sheath protein FI